MVETLGIRIRVNYTNIKGIKTEIAEYLAARYADDLWVALEPNSENINNLLEEIENFCKFSGLRINYDKTVAFKLGPCRETDAKYYTMKKLFWTNEPVKILGIYFHPDRKKMESKNYGEKMEKIENILKTWQKRKLNIAEKIVMINALIISQLQFLLMNTPTPDKSL